MKIHSFQIRDNRLVYVLMLVALLWMPFTTLLLQNNRRLANQLPSELRKSLPASMIAAHDVAQLNAGMQQATYQFNWDSRQDAYTAPNPAQGYRVSLAASGVEVNSSLPDPWTWRLSLSAWGYGDFRQPVNAQGNLEQAGGEYDRVEIRYPGLTEWFRNGAVGLEHGFVIAERQPGSLTQNDILSLDFEYSGTFAPRQAADGQRIDFRSEVNGEVQLQYDQLKVWDSAGTALPAWLQVLPAAGGSQSLIRLQVDTAGARYPLFIDPHLTTLSATLQAADGAANDHFGYSVDVSGDTTIIGSPGPVSTDPDAPDPTSSTDKAYIFYRNRGGADQWDQVIGLQASGADTLQMFGFSVAISGDIAAVGAPRYDVSGRQNQGAVYIFYRNQGGADNWGQVALITAADGGSGDKFGWDIALQKDLLVVGSPNRDESGFNNLGSVYLFKRNAGGADQWGQVARLSAGDAATNDRFGYAVDMDGDHILVGAPYKPSDDSAANQFQGAAYMFRFDPNDPQKYAQVRKITAADGDQDDYFGWSVSVDHDHAVIGAPGRVSQQGAAYVLERNAGGAENWGQVKLLLPFDPSNGAQFGDEVDLEEATIVVGAYTKTISSFFGGGAAYIFERNQAGADNWGQVTRLVNTAGAASNDHFGRAIGIDGSNLVIGADGIDLSGNADQGAAFGYYHTGITWQLVASPAANDGATNDQLGCDVAVNPEILVLGACRDDGAAGTDQGAVYIFYRNTGGVENWGQVRKLTAPDAVANALFGSSVAIQNDKLLVGAPGDDSERGSAYLYYRNQGGAENWGHFQTITASTRSAGDQFAADVSLGVNQAAVGAPGANGGEGRAYVFYRTDLLANPWQEQKVLSVSGSGSFGASISIMGDKLLVGAPDSNSAQGSAYIYYRNEGGADGWGLKKTLTASNGAAGDKFGSAVDLFFGQAVVGAPARASSTGAVYLFRQNTGGAENWGQLLTRAGGAAGSHYGAAVDQDGDILVVGAPGVNTAYTYKRNLTGADAWGLFQALTGSSGEEYGHAVSLLEDTLAVAAPQFNSARGHGYVYLLTEFFQDVSVDKTVSPLRVAPGDDISFVINFANQGDGEATSVSIDDNLPGVLTDVQVATSGYPVQPGGVTGSWTIDTLPVGASGTITMTGTIGATAASGTYTNLVTITATEPEIYYDNNTASVDFEVDADGPLPPQLVYPANGAVITLNSDVLLQWQNSPSPDIASFRVYFNGLVLPVAGQTLMLNNVLDGVYSWYVTGVDDLGNIGAPSSTWSFEVATGLTENRLPVADAGPNQVVLPGGLVTLDGSNSSDPDGHTPLSFLWTQISGPPVVFDEFQPIVTFTAPDAPGTMLFELVVTDLFGLSSVPDRVAVVISESGFFENYLPVMRSGSAR